MIVCGMIVGPGEADRYLRPVLAKAAAWADKIVVYADHIDKATDTILTLASDGHCPLEWYENLDSREPSFREDESYVRNELLAALDEQCDDGDLVVIVDADETLHPRPLAGEAALLGGGQERRVLEALERDQDHQAWSATFYHLWEEDGSLYRVDGGWAPASQFRIYRHQNGARVPARAMACKAIPDTAEPRAHTTLIVAHWGYARIEDRAPKQARYMELDGGRYHSLAHLQSITDQDPQLARFPPR